MNSEKRLLTETQVEEVYGLQVRTLQQWRIRGFGPAFVKVGRSVRYRPADLERFIEANIRTCTREQEPAQG